MGVKGKARGCLQNQRKCSRINYQPIRYQFITGLGKQHNIGQERFIWVDKICPQPSQLRRIG